MVLCIETGEDNVPFIQLGTHQLRLDLEELNEEEKERAVEEIREIPENIEHGLKKLRQLIEAEKSLYVPLDNDSFLIKFLRPCKFQPELAFKFIKRFYKFKVKHPNYGINITPQCVRKVFDDQVFSFLPTRTSSGCRVMVINSGAKWNPKEVKLEDMFKAVMVTIEIAMLEPKTQLAGVHVIIDLAGLSLVHICQFSPQTAKLILDWVQDCAPVRLKGIHLINQPYIFNILYQMFKPFLGEKLKKCLFFHGTDKKSLTEKISEESLPPYYGGTADIPDFPGRLFSDMLFFYERDFEVFNTYGYVTKKEKAQEN
ncbi:alpha-tocopherol transfer protein-like [Anoplophora glabripennis]|uniref:alpha-tocopherol transfer protein-like n=1 Tax=Anoplophora glabripennis TaxID=217634 RepID=UPI00087396EF|nr:alpha-tocopherol transfer protein-like [Anoplophora glabripennis]XP_018569346.1 alpha-tocopherol transfer protein-like [Anoplophora glabripennis]XP_018569347.1 alpha-tocopherol transfer protein-like [Anoplophora glabripennis]